MLQTRVAALRAPFTATVARAARTARSSTELQPWRRVAQQVSRRGYASGGDHHKQPGSDIPWMAGSIVATAAGSYFLLQQAPKKSDHGHGHGDEHGEEHKEEGGEEEAPAEEPAEEEPAQDESAEDTKEESSSDEPKKDAAGKVGSEERGTGEQTGDKSRNEGKPEMPETPDKKENEAAEGEEGKDKDEGKVVKGPEDKTGPEGVQQKGATVKADEDTRKLEPSSQGPKKRVDSPYQTDLGAGETTRDEPGSKKDNPVAAKEPGSFNQMSGKQAGLSTTASRHSSDIHNNPEKSSKSEGTAETAKLSGTVDPARKQK